MDVLTQKQEYNEESSPYFWSPSLIKLCEQRTQVCFITDPESVETASKDFGGLAQGKTAGIALPRTPLECKSLINFANSHHLKFVIRGKGYSQGGQTLIPLGGATLDCSQMTRVAKPDLKNLTITCESGTTWNSVVTITSPYGLVPQVIPFFPDLTVGGVLSVGGIGGNSHLYGCVSGNIHELKVVTGAGEDKVCSSTQDSSLFEATLCGVGRCAVITEATLLLRKFKSKVKTFYLRYEDHEMWLMDQRLCAESKTVTYLEAFCAPVPLGLYAKKNTWSPLTYWMYSLQVSLEYETEEPTEADLPIGNYREIVKSRVSDTLGFLRRYGARAENMKKSGGWKLVHPWWECIFSIDIFARVLPELLEKLPILLGDGLGYRVFLINKDCPSSFMKPASDLAVGFAVLPGGVEPHNLQQVLKSLQDINDWLLPLGGKRYLSGWLSAMTEASWQQHFGSYYQKWKKAKEMYDPNGVLQSILFQRQESFGS